MADTTAPLLERTTGGLHVALTWLPIMGEAVLTATAHGDSVAVTVPPERIRDAFDHPTCYLNPAQVDRLFPRTPSAD